MCVCVGGQAFRAAPGARRQKRLLGLASMPEWARAAALLAAVMAVGVHDVAMAVGGKRCDEFRHNGTTVCGPGMFLIGLGGCH